MTLPRGVPRGVDQQAAIVGDMLRRIASLERASTSGTGGGGGGESGFTFVQEAEPPTTGPVGSTWYRPSDGQAAVLVGGTWVPYGGGGGGGSGFTFTQDAEPTTQQPKDTWWQSNTGRSFVWHDDGDSQQWVQFAPGGGSGGQLAYIEQRKVDRQRVTKTNSTTLGTDFNNLTYISETYIGLPVRPYDRWVQINWNVQMNGDCTFAGIRPTYRLNGVGNLTDNWIDSWQYSSSSQASGYHNNSGSWGGPGPNNTDPGQFIVPAGQTFEARLYGYANTAGVVAQGTERTWMEVIATPVEPIEVKPYTDIVRPHDLLIQSGRTITDFVGGVGQTDVVYPKPYASLPIVVATVSETGQIWTANTFSNTVNGFTPLAWRSTGTGDGTGRPFHWIAIGVPADPTDANFGGNAGTGTTAPGDGGGSTEDLPLGVMAVTSSAADQPIVPGVQFITGANPVHRMVTGRRYKLCLHLDMQGTTNDVWVIEHRTYLAGAATVHGRTVVRIVNTGSSFTVDSHVLLQGNDNESYNPVIYRAGGGTGNGQINGAPGRTVQCWIEDMGVVR